MIAMTAEDVPLTMMDVLKELDSCKDDCGTLFSYERLVMLVVRLRRERDAALDKLSEK